MIPPNPDIVLPPEYPALDYPPFGYLDNPHHSAVMNRSGIIRSVPPLGFGFWCRRFPWPYGEGALRHVNYLSFLHLGVVVDDLALLSAEDFARAGIRLGSRYHTKRMMSYEWEADGLTFSAKYFLAEEHALACMLEVSNLTDRPREVFVHVSNEYGHVERPWWGSDGLASTFDAEHSAAVCKMWAYGDVFALGADREPLVYKATPQREEWEHWTRSNDLTSNEGASVSLPLPMFSTLAYRLTVPKAGEEQLVLSLTRGTNQLWTLRRHREVLTHALVILDRQLQEDREFYRSAPVLSGDWPHEWKQGWVLDFETLRMNTRPAIGIYQHPWDAMQIYTPRAVLGETMLDMMCLSYADAELAKEVIYGTFADAPMPNVPCSREDGSMNMVGAGGAECGTAPTWGLPFHVISCLHHRTGDDAWVRDLYPHLRAFLEWWLENRTDEEGWFHCNNSWESGQDGSRRFLIDVGEEAKVSDYVRTVDVEAVMAHAFAVMEELASVAGHESDVLRWRELAQKRIETTRAMYVDGWFRDFDARTGEPIILENYYDVMMLVPLSVGIATPEQVEGVRPMFQRFADEPTPFLEWPSFWFPFSEAAWNAGLRPFLAEILTATADRVYSRTAGRKLTPMGDTKFALPEPYNYRMPGQAAEFWPVEMHPQIRNGAECYGWGATMPTLLIRNIIGFRELGPGEFLLAPSLPERMTKEGSTYAVSNLKYDGMVFDARYTVLNHQRLRCDLLLRSERAAVIGIEDAEGHSLIAQAIREGTTDISFELANHGFVRVTLV